MCLEAGERQYCFILDAVVIGVEVGEEKGGGGKNHPKIPVKKKMLKPRLPSERFIKRRLNPLLTTEKTDSSLGPSERAPLQSGLSIQPEISSLGKHL